MSNLLSTNGRNFRWFIFLAALLPIVSLLSGCSASSSTAGQDLNMAPLLDMPVDVQKAAVSVQEAYQFAVANPEALKNVPCYCGCDAAGHTSNYSCYVKEGKSSGELVFDQHALGCSICVDITQDVMKMTLDGKTSKEIRTAIDQTYSQYGPSNMPPAQ